MNDSSHGSREYGDRTVRQRLDAATADSDRSIALECLVVRYRDRPDRCTITPRECSDDERLTHWLSADTTAIVDLEAMR